MEDRLLTLLESISTNMVRIADAQQATLERLHQDNLQLAELVDHNSRSIVEMVERSSRSLAELIDQNSRAMAEILKYVIDTTTRTERMTGEILTRLAAGQGH